MSFGSRRPCTRQEPLLELLLELEMGLMSRKMGSTNGLLGYYKPIYTCLMCILISSVAPLITSIGLFAYFWLVILLATSGRYWWKSLCNQNIEAIVFGIYHKNCSKAIGCFTLPYQCTWSRLLTTRVIFHLRVIIVVDGCLFPCSMTL